MNRYGKTVVSLKQEKKKIRPINKARKEGQGLYQEPELMEANTIEYNMSSELPGNQAKKGTSELDISY